MNHDFLKMFPKIHQDVRAVISQMLLGIWFTYSGGLKVFGTGLDRFTQDIANYRLVAAPYDAVAAYLVPWVEIIAGLCLIVGLFRRGALLVIAGLVLVFSFCIGWAWFHQLDIACGCHGSDAPIRYWSKAAELAGYLVLLAWLWWMETKDPAKAVSATESAQNS